MDIMGTQDSIDLSILIISYNTCPLTLECIDSIYREMSDINFEVIAFDNASKDGSAEAIANRFPKVQLIASDVNQGFAKGNNLAAKEAKGQYLLLLNPDTVVLEDAIGELYSFAIRNPDAGIWGGKTVFADGTLNADFCYRKMTLWSLFCRTFGLASIFRSSKLFNSEVFGSWNYDSVREVDIVTGCFMLIKADLWKALQGFNPLFFMYGEEVDFCLRAYERGCQPLYTPEAVIVHYGGSSESDQAGRIIKTLCGEITLIYEHWPKFWSWFGVTLMKTRVSLKAMLYQISGVFLQSDKYRAKALLWREVNRQRVLWVNGWVSEGTEVRKEPYR